MISIITPTLISINPLKDLKVRKYKLMPLTSASNGNGINKIHVGQILSLPASLRSNDTYAVFNQVRTVNASRFISLKEGKTVIEALFPQEKFQQLSVLALKN